MRVIDSCFGSPLTTNLSQSMGRIMGKDQTEKFDEKEAHERFEAALRGALKTPHEPLKTKQKTEKPKKRPGRNRTSGK